MGYDSHEAFLRKNGGMIAGSGLLSQKAFDVMYWNVKRRRARIGKITLKPKE